MRLPLHGRDRRLCIAAGLTAAYLAVGWLLAPPAVHAHPASWLVGNVLLNGAVALVGALVWGPVLHVPDGTQRPVYYHRALLVAVPLAVWTTIQQAGRDAPLRDGLTPYHAWTWAGEVAASVVIWLCAWGVLTGALRRAFESRDAAG